MGPCGVGDLCALFATSNRDRWRVVHADGLLALPSMLKAGYDKKLASSIIAAGGHAGILIQPSHHA